MWTTIRFTEKLLVDCHHKGHIVLSHKTLLQRQFDGEYLWSKSVWHNSIGIYGAEQLQISEATVDLVLLAALEQFEYQATNRLLFAALRNIKIQSQHKRMLLSQNTTTNFK